MAVHCAEQGLILLTPRVAAPTVIERLRGRARKLYQGDRKGRSYSSTPQQNDNLPMPVSKSFTVVARSLMTFLTQATTEAARASVMQGACSLIHTS